MKKTATKKTKISEVKEENENKEQEITKIQDDVKQCDIYNQYKIDHIQKIK
jgi:hypothetical protein